MAYAKKTWVDRQAEYPGRRRLTATGTTDVYDVAREEGLIVEEGDALNAQNLNDLEGRIEAGLAEKAQIAHTHGSGDLTGLSQMNVGSASKLAAKRTIALSGGATGTATGFDGSANITIPVTALDMSKATAGTLPAARGGTGATSLGSITVGNSTKWGNYTIWKGTQAQYNGLSSKSSTTVYFIVG